MLIGSLPGGAPFRSIANWSACTPCPMVLDFRGEGLFSVLDLKPYVVKPNREELGQTFGRSLDDDADLLAAMRELNRLGAQWVVVTQGAAGRLGQFLGAVYRLVPPRIAEVVNPIGCGDALAAGIAWATRGATRSSRPCVLASAPPAIIFESYCRAGSMGRAWRIGRARSGGRGSPIACGYRRANPY